MDNFIIRWYNQNRRAIWTVIVTFIIAVSIIQSLERYYKNKAKDKSSSTISTTANETNNYALITEEEINKGNAKTYTNLIDEFFKFCNEGDIEEAYNLLSNSCKEELYPTLEDFKNRYYNKVFTKEVSYTSKLWITSGLQTTYRIQIFEDMLATGEKDNKPIEEYYTISMGEDGYKLNISKFIKKEKLNISKTQDDITVDIVSRKIYMDYEIYEISVTNKKKNNLIFNTKDHTNSIYIQDENGLKYIAYINEIADSEFEMLYGETKTYNIRFNRGYKPNIKIEKIVFEDIDGANKITIDL